MRALTCRIARRCCATGCRCSAIRMTPASANASPASKRVEHHFERNQGPGPLARIRGAEIAVNLSANHHADHGAYLFGKILHHALSQYGDLNQTLSMKLLLDGETHADWGRSTMADMSLMRETALSLEQAPAPESQGESVGGPKSAGCPIGRISSSCCGALSVRSRMRRGSASPTIAAAKALHHPAGGYGLRLA